MKELLLGLADVWLKKSGPKNRCLLDAHAKLVALNFICGCRLYKTWA